MQSTYNPKVGWAWALYDWANSVYNLVITATLFPIYFAIIATSDGNENAEFLGMTFKSTVLYDYSVAFAYLIIALILPLLSGIADSGGYKKRFMQFFTLLGAASCSLLFFFNEQRFDMGVVLMMTAVIGYAGSLVFYNSFLPEIAPPEMHDKWSARGFSLGYFGSSLLLIASVLCLLNPHWFFNVDQVTAQLATQFPELDKQAIDLKASAYFMRQIGPYIFLTVGIWWIGFAMIPFYHLPTNPYKKKREGRAFLKGYREIQKVWGEIRGNKVLKRYLGGFFFFNMATQTIMLVAVIFAKNEVKMESGDLITTVLIMQFVAILGAFLFSMLSRKTYNTLVLRIAVVIWITICLMAYFVQNSTEFYILAAMVGLVMGGTQALARSTYSKLLPDTTDHASYFSFYDVSEKIGIVLGLLLFGVIDDITGSMRNSTVALSLLYGIGLVWLFMLPKVPGITSPKARS
jgi:UMF1 family MFS transporter